jgi:hypothetical protein
MHLKFEDTTPVADDAVDDALTLAIPPLASFSPVFEDGRDALVTAESERQWCAVAADSHSQRTVEDASRGLPPPPLAGPAIISLAASRLLVLAGDRARLLPHTTTESRRS